MKPIRIGENSAGCWPNSSLPSRKRELKNLSISPMNNAIPGCWNNIRISLSVSQLIISRLTSVLQTLHLAGSGSVLKIKRLNEGSRLFTDSVGVAGLPAAILQRGDTNRLKPFAALRFSYFSAFVNYIYTAAK